MPFAGYKDFADCVAKNRDKDDPQAYCAAIQRKAEQGSSEYHRSATVRHYSNPDPKPEPETAPKANQHTGWWKGHL